MKQLLFALIISTFFSTNIIAQGSLTGLKYFIVQVSFDKDLETEGYNSETIKTDTELELRLADLNVINYEQYDYDKINKTASLVIEVRAMVEEIGYIFHISVGVMEAVTVPRLNRDDYAAMTWGKSTLGITPSGYKGWRFIRDNVKDLVDKFLNAYLKDNPKN